MKLLAVLLSVTLVDGIAVAVELEPHRLMGTRMTRLLPKRAHDKGAQPEKIMTRKLEPDRLEPIYGKLMRRGKRLSMEWDSMPESHGRHSSDTSSDLMSDSPQAQEDRPSDKIGDAFFVEVASNKDEKELDSSRGWQVPVALTSILVIVLVVAAVLSHKLLIGGPCGKDDKGDLGCKTRENTSKRRNILDHILKLASARGSDKNRIPSSLIGIITKSFVNDKVAILVSDMSGFTRLTREHGIVHFAAIIIRFRQICLPILHHFNVMLITTEGDNFIAMFPDASSAAAAAHAMLTTVAKYNDDLPAEKKHFTLTLNGIGIDYGPGPLVDMHDKFYGSTVSLAYELGEDLCESGQILITGNVKKELLANPEFPKSTYDSVHRSDAAEAASKGNGVYAFCSSGGGDSPTAAHDDSFSRQAAVQHVESPKEQRKTFPIPDVNDDRYLSAELMPLARLHDMSLTPKQFQELEQEIKEKTLLYRSVLMISFESDMNAKPEVQIKMQNECLKQIRKALDVYGGKELEEELFIFANSSDATLAALHIREALSEYQEVVFQSVLTSQSSGNKDPPLTPISQIKGYGIHEGHVLFLPGTDVHWGDPVNTASKLGQDCTEGGNLIISDTAYKTVSRDPRCGGLDFHLQQVSKSKLKFDCYNVVRADRSVASFGGFKKPSSSHERVTEADAQKLINGD